MSVLKLVIYDKYIVKCIFFLEEKKVFLLE